MHAVGICMHAAVIAESQPATCPCTQVATSVNVESGGDSAEEAMAELSGNLVRCWWGVATVPCAWASVLCNRVAAESQR